MLQPPTQRWAVSYCGFLCLVFIALYPRSLPFLVVSCLASFITVAPLLIYPASNSDITPHRFPAFIIPSAFVRPLPYILYPLCIYYIISLLDTLHPSMDLLRTCSLLSLSIPSPVYLRLWYVIQHIMSFTFIMISMSSALCGLILGVITS